jgi:hypothetical protein
MPRNPSVLAAQRDLQRPKSSALITEQRRFLSLCIKRHKRRIYYKSKLIGTAAHAARIDCISLLRIAIIVSLLKFQRLALQI